MAGIEVPLAQNHYTDVKSDHPATFGLLHKINIPTRPFPSHCTSRGARWSKWTPRAILVALLFSKLQTFLNNNPEGNPLKSVYLTPKIALKFGRIGCRNGRLVTIAICFSHSLFRATKLIFMANYSYCRGA